MREQKHLEGMCVHVLFATQNLKKWFEYYNLLFKIGVNKGTGFCFVSVYSYIEYTKNFQTKSQLYELITPCLVLPNQNLVPDNI